MKKTRAVNSWSKHNVPEDIWPDILSRLHVKSLLRFRCVSRSWRAFIDDPEFARVHFTRFNNDRLQSHLFAVQKTTSVNQKTTSVNEECVVRCSETLRTTSRLGFLRTRSEAVDGTFSLRKSRSRGYRSCYYVVCSMDGLFMLMQRSISETRKLILWNPSIRKSRFLPPSPSISRAVNFGLGFDPCSRDYKFVRFYETRIQIYTLGTDSWKSIEFQGEGCSSFSGNFSFRQFVKSICFKGVLYGIGRDGNYGIPFQLVSFDLSSEKFASTGLPKAPNPHSGLHSQALTMIDDGHSLAVVNFYGFEGSMWALENLGGDIKSWSWTQRYTFAPAAITNDVDYDRNIRFLSLKKNGGMLLRWPIDRVITSYNLETHEEKILLKKTKFLDCWPYMESLILL